MNKVLNGFGWAISNTCRLSVTRLCHGIALSNIWTQVHAFLLIIYTWRKEIRLAVRTEGQTYLRLTIDINEANLWFNTCNFVYKIDHIMITDRTSTDKNDAYVKANDSYRFFEIWATMSFFRVSLIALTSFCWFDLWLQSHRTFSYMT